MLKSAMPKKVHLKTLDVLYLISAPFHCGQPRGAHNGIAELHARASGAPLLRKFGILSIPENLVITSEYTHPYTLWGSG